MEPGKKSPEAGPPQVGAPEAEFKTPMKDLNQSDFSTPRFRTPRSEGKTPGSRRRLMTPGSCDDRFIANRSNMEFELNYHMMMKYEKEKAMEAAGEKEELSPYQQQYQQIMSENLNGRDISKARVLRFWPRQPKPPEAYVQVLHNTTWSGTKQRTLRYIPRAPEHVLDAPELIDDFYLNLLDWSQKNLMAVALRDVVYLWNASNREITELVRLSDTWDYVTSLSWGLQGRYLAVATHLGEVQLWDVQRTKKVWTMAGHPRGIPSLAWNSYTLSSGSRDGKIHHHDVREAKKLIGETKGHMQEVCGLRWSPDGHYLASGSNDNRLHIWSSNLGHTQPLFTSTEHKSAVKGLAWCPWNNNLLASGGGSNDRHIRLWNCCNGSRERCVDTQSQVSAILWSKEYRELVSGHGLPNFQLSIWKYPELTKVTDLTGHTGRVLHMTMSPDETTVFSAAADETLRMWKCFELDKSKKPARKSLFKESMLLRSSIR